MGASLGGMGGGGKKKESSSPTINITPLVDVVLVVLIIFMIVTPMVTKTFWLNLPPKDKNEEPPPPSDNKPLVMTVDKAGVIRTVRNLPDMKGSERQAIERVGPVFFIGSTEPGMAALCSLQCRVQGKGAASAQLLQECQALISDGPFSFAPGTIAASDLAQLKHFEVRCGRDVLGTLALTPVPTASFNQEGGFTAPDAFDWSAAAEEQLQDKLSELTGS